MSRSPGRIFRHRSAVRIAGLLLLSTLVAACAPSVGVRRISEREADRRLVSNVLATGDPSAWSLQTLHRNALLDLYREDRALALRRLHESLAEPGLERVRVRERLFALSELSFDHARREGERRFWRGEDPRPWFLASAVYAQGFVRLDREGASEGTALDSRTRLAADLYNRGLTEGLEVDGRLEVADGERTLPFGTLALDLDESSLRWGSFLLEDFVPTADLATRGIANRYRHPGVGASLAASVAPDPERSGPDRERIGPRTQVPCTLVLIVDFSLEALLAGELHGRLELYAADVARQIAVGDRLIPLEADPSAALAMQLDRFTARVDTTRAFLSGDLAAFGAAPIRDQLAILTPYRRGRIPVVFVHGTNSDPTTWSEMLNELQNDPVLSDRLQYWFFFYASGNPIGYSGGLLADALRHIVRELDPEASDPALQNLVVIGHSQGGLLTKLSAVDSGPAFWDALFTKPVEALEVSEETRESLRRSLVFEPVEAVTRVVFISTPHGGSFLTQNPLANLVQGLISVPGEVGGRFVELVRQDPDALALGRLERLPTSLDNMRAGNPFLETLRSLPVVDGVAVHSIVAARSEGPKEKLSDGVVKYTSAHISQGTERLVRSGHSAHVHPEAIAEVRRVLREHLAEVDLPPPGSSDVPHPTASPQPPRQEARP